MSMANLRLDRGQLLVEIRAPKRHKRIAGVIDHDRPKIGAKACGLFRQCVQGYLGARRFPRRIAVVGVYEILVVLSDRQHELHILFGDLIHIRRRRLGCARQGCHRGGPDQNARTEETDHGS